MTEAKFNDQNTLAYAILSSRWSPFLLPPGLWIASWLLQVAASEFVGMNVSNGFFIVQLSRGVVFVSLLVFGPRALISLSAGYAGFYWIYPGLDIYRTFTNFFFQNFAETLISMFFIELYRRINHLNVLFDDVTMRQIVYMMIGITLVATVFKFVTEDYAGSLDVLPLIIYQLLGSMIGFLFVFFAFVQSFSMLEQLRFR